MVGSVAIARRPPDMIQPISNSPLAPENIARLGFRIPLFPVPQASSDASIIAGLALLLLNRPEVTLYI